MIASLRHFLGWLVSAFRSRDDLVLEDLALHQQLRALHAQRPRRRLTALHKLFWVALRTSWSGWRKPLVLVTPRTVVNWHSAGFRPWSRGGFGCEGHGKRANSNGLRSPWQNGVAERWVGSCRRDLLDHVIILNERHLKRLMSSYLLYYHQDRTHPGLAKDTPASRPTEIPIPSARERKIQSFPRLGGLHHRYAVAA
jgi:hypothetical protein